MRGTVRSMIPIPLFIPASGEVAASWRFISCCINGEPQQFLRVRAEKLALLAY